MNVQVIRADELRTVAGGSGIQGREGVLYTVPRNGSTLARTFVWDGEKHVEIASTAMQALASGAWTPQNMPLPVHLPVLSPERHAAMAPIVVGGLTCSYQAGGERGRGVIRLSTAGAITSTALRLPLPLSAEYGQRARVSGRVHLRVRCSDWSQVTRLYVGIGQGGAANDYHLLKVAEANVTRCGATDPNQSAVWNNTWRTIIEHSDKKIVVGSPAAWDKSTRYFDTDGLIFTVTTAGAVTLEFDRVYSPDWPVGYVVNILDGAYKSALDLVKPAFDQRGWKFGVSGNRVDGSTIGVTTYPTLATLRNVAAAGHDVFAHGHYLSGSTPVPMTAAVTEAESLEILSSQRSAIGGALGGAGAKGMQWHQWLTNTGRYAGSNMAGLLRSLGVRAARGDTTDAQYGIDPWNAKNSTWATAPATGTGGVLCGYVSHRGPMNRAYMEWFAAATPAARDTYAGSAYAATIDYAATCADGVVGYTHNIVPFDGTNPTTNDSGTNFWRDYLADLDSKVAAGRLVVLSPSQLEQATYWRQGDVYLSWDGEWRNRSDDAIAF